MIKISTLSNGLRVATDEMQDAESVVVGAWVGVGTRHEPWNANGVAHFVEHMMFKGTKRRSAFDISSEIEKNGGMMNAHTSREETAYYARVLPEDAERAMDIIADMLQHSRFAAEELERERQVIIQEIGRDIDTPEDHVYDLFSATAFPKQKIGRSILGSSTVISKLPRSAIIDYVKRHYHAGSLVIVGAGKIAHEDMVRYAQKYFGKLPRGRVAKTDPAHTGSGEIRQQDDSEQLHVMLGFKGPGRKARSYYAASLLGIVLGGTSSSRLFQKVREERGLVYSVSASHTAFQDAGVFTIYAGTDPKRVRELIPVTCRELKDVTRHVTGVELDRAKAQIRADLLMGRESVMRRAEILGHQILAYGKTISPDTVLNKVLAVSCTEVIDTAQKLFSQKPILAALGPCEELESYQSLIKRL